MKLLTVLHDAPHDGAGDLGDGLIRVHFRSLATARRYVAEHEATLYGEPITLDAAEVEDVPSRIAERWVRQGKVIG